jgi:hypothetical protein
MPAAPPLLRAIAARRLPLAEDIARHSPGIGDDDLTDAVARTIERALVLRLGEERGIIPAGTLAALRVAGGIHERLCAHYEQIAGTIAAPAAPAPPVGDAPLRALLATLIPPHGPCQSPPTPLTILGQVHEAFHDRPIRRVPGQRPTVARGRGRKATGVYYTPDAVVEYLVARTLDDLLAGQSPEATAALTILDPACGAGAFLLGAYRHLLAWYRARALQARRRRDGGALIRSSDGAWHLSLTARRDILLAHIHGVDRDPRAVELTRLTLLLALREGVPGESDALPVPDLARTIRCGDALLGPDFRESPAARGLGEGEIAALNPFDWEAAFPAIGARGGFDAVIGNPPYLSYSGRQAVALPAPVRRYLLDRYAGAGWPAAHAFFITRAARDLARRRVAFVVPDQVGHLAGYAPTRALLARESRLVEVYYWGERVFAGAITPALTFVADRHHDGPATIREPNRPPGVARLADGRPWQDDRHATLLAKIRDGGDSLGALVADPGVHTGNCARALLGPLADAPAGVVPILEGRQVGRYRCAPPAKALRLDYAPGPGDYFAIRPVARYADAPFLIRQTAPYPIVGPRRGAVYFRNSLLALYPPADGRAVEWLVGLLNSSLMRYVYRAAVRESRQRAFPQVKVGALRALPIRRPDLADPRDRALHDAIVATVRALLALHEDHDASPPERERAELRTAAEVLDRRIDREVYELYRLDEGEVGLIEASMHRMG